MIVTAPSQVSVIIVSWNSEKFIAGCLNSLASQVLLPAEVIVVDNGSTDASVRIARERAPSAHVLEMGSNTGFCHANNVGLGEAIGDAVLFLNPDIFLDRFFIVRALEPFAADERIGSVSGKLLRFDRRTVDTAGQCVGRSRRVIERGYGQIDEGRFERPGYIFSVCGAAAFYRRRAIEDLRVRGEFFDPDFFAFSEDLDIGWRARNAGWRAYYEPRAVGYHYRGGSGTDAGPARALAAIFRRSAEVRTHILRNRYLTILKNDSLPDLFRDLPFVLARDLALSAVAIASGPRVIASLMRSGPLLASARRRRREFLAARGVWGERRCALPSAWTGPRLLEENE